MFNNKEPNGAGILVFLTAFALLLFFFSGFYSPVNIPAEEPEEEEEPATVSEDRFINIVLDEVEDSTSDKITFQKIELDADCTVLVINDVCYLTVDHGFGSSHSTALTVMYDEDGNVLTYDKLYELGGEN